MGVGELPVLVEVNAGFDVEGYLVGYMLEKRRVVVWNEIEIIKEAAGIRRDGRWISRKRLIRVINEIPRRIERVRTVREAVEHGRIHSANESVILISGWFSGNQDAHALASGEIYDVLTFLGYGVNAIDFDDGHLVLIEFNEESSECGHVDYSRHVRLSRGEIE